MHHSVPDFGGSAHFKNHYNYDSNAGAFAPNTKSLLAQALEIRRFLRDRDEKEIVVLLHRDLLHNATGDLHEDRSQAKGD